MSTSTKPTAADIVPGAVVFFSRIQFHRGRGILRVDGDNVYTCIPGVVTAVPLAPFKLDKILAMAIRVIPPAPEVPHDRP